MSIITSCIRIHNDWGRRNNAHLNITLMKVQVMLPSVACNNLTMFAKVREEVLMKYCKYVGFCHMEKDICICRTKTRLSSVTAALAGLENARHTSVTSVTSPS